MCFMTFKLINFNYRIHDKMYLRFNFGYFFFVKITIAFY